MTKLNVVVYWDICDETTNECQLCRRPLLAPSLQELNSDKTVILGKIVIGECKHMFHDDCMNDLINSGCLLCPVDKTTWKLHKSIKSGAVYSKPKSLLLKTKK